MIAKRLIASGCSFTYGQGLADPQTEAWPAVLGKQLGLEVVNLAQCGASNYYIVNSLMDFMITDHQPGDFYICGWSHWSRWTFTNFHGKKDHILHNHMKSNKFAQLLFENYYNEDELYKNYFRHIVTLQSLFQSKNIPYYMMESLAQLHPPRLIYKFQNYADAVDKNYFLDFQKSSFTTLNFKKTLPDGHPSA